MRLVVRDSEDGALCAFEVIQAHYNPNKGLCAEVRTGNENTEGIVISEGVEDHVFALAHRTYLNLSDYSFVWDEDEEEGEDSL